jgi:AraC-like DNA-binding protein
MDFPTKHWAPFTRRHPSVFAVASANHLAAKTQWIRTAFSTCNFSFILRGHGEFHRLGRRWQVEAPCVITQWPDDYLEYGPLAAPGGGIATWEELYVVYAPETKPRFEAARLLDPERPIWPILDLGAVRIQAEALRQLAHAAEPESVADRVDRVCERMILESWLPPARREAPEGDAATVQAIADELRARLAEPSLSPESLAARHGWSPSTFRRRWGEVMTESPARLLQGLRMRAACLLLVESTLPIHEIAARSGFADEYYFSRRFRIEQGMSPRAYRRAYLLRRE